MRHHVTRERKWQRGCGIFKRTSSLGFESKTTPRVLGTGEKNMICSLEGQKSKTICDWKYPRSDYRTDTFSVWHMIFFMRSFPRCSLTSPKCPRRHGQKSNSTYRSLKRYLSFLSPPFFIMLFLIFIYICFNCVVCFSCECVLQHSRIEVNCWWAIPFFAHYKWSLKKEEVILAGLWKTKQTNNNNKNSDEKQTNRNS